MKDLILHIWYSLFPKQEESSVVPLFIFICKREKGQDIPTKVYYALDKEDIYAYTHLKELTGHIKEDIYSAKEAEKLSKTTEFIHPIPRK